MNASTPAEALAHAINSSPWLYPAANVVHVLGVILLAGSLIAFDLRLLGVTRAGDVRDLARVTLPWSLLGFGIAVPAGLVLFGSDSTALLSNGAFRLKLLLLLLAGVNAAALHASGALKTLVPSTAVPLRPRFHAAASILLWVGVIVCGRMIAYV